MEPDKALSAADRISINMGFSAPRYLKRRLEEAAKKDRRSMSQVVRLAVERYLEETQQQSA